MMADTAQESRIMELEIRLAHLEAMMDDMSEVMAAQGKMVDMLTHRVRMLSEQLRNADLGRSPQDDQPPPHY